jgi:hypothetical protein
MNDYCGRFRFAVDMNGDSAFTISDVWLMLEYGWLLPAKVVVGWIHAIPNLATFFEVDCQTGEGWGGGIFSFFVWGVVFLIAWGVVVATRSQGDA